MARWLVIVGVIFQLLGVVLIVGVVLGVNHSVGQAILSSLHCSWGDTLQQLEDGRQVCEADNEIRKDVGDSFELVNALAIAMLLLIGTSLQIWALMSHKLLPTGGVQIIHESGETVNTFRFHDPDTGVEITQRTVTFVSDVDELPFHMKGLVKDLVKQMESLDFEIPSLDARMKMLEEMLNSGMLSQEEYEFIRQKMLEYPAE